MNRSLFVLAPAVALTAIAAPRTAHAQQPTPQQIEKAKKAFADGKKAFDAGDFPEAASKFKESYNLSKNPVLLYNVGLANEAGGMDDIALFYFRKFLTDAPADNPQRADAEARVKTLEKKFGGGTAPTTGGTTATTGGTGTEPTTGGETTPPPTEPKKPIKMKPPGTYTEADVQHQMIDVAPPKKPLDVTAFVPEDSGFTVTLYYRTAGEGKFASKEMKWRYKELVGRIPPEKMIGDSVQYYIEAKDSAGAVVARKGKSTSPNLITLEAGATPRFYPDFTEDGEVKSQAETVQEDLEEDPLTGRKKTTKPDPDDIEIQPEVPPGGGNGLTDVGSSKFKYMKWGSTATAGAALGLSVTFFILAGRQASNLEADSTMCGAPPCRMFDSYDRDLEAAGKRNQTIHRVTLGVGVVAAAVAGYYWYKEMKAKKRGEVKVSAKAGSPETSWSVVPTLGRDDASTFMGASALTRF